MIDLAPIVLFVFCRPDHAHRTLDALKNNVLAAKSVLIVYSDGARTETEAEHVGLVRDIVRKTTGFADVRLIERKTNYGLARNITDGVSEVCQEYGRVIVLEDDLVTSSHFLTFMNEALNRYVEDRRIWHVSGWNYPIDVCGLPDAFFWRAMNCWGWGTWSDRWQHFHKDADALISTWNACDVRQFNLDGAYNFWRHVVRNHRGTLNTWAIFWYATIYEAGGLCLNPTRSLVTNIGHDGSGENCGSDDPFSSPLVDRDVVDWPTDVRENAVALKRIQQVYIDMRPSLVWSVASRLSRLFAR